MKKIMSIVVIGGLLVVATPSSAQPAKVESIKLLMEKTGSKELGKQIMAQMIPGLKRYAPDAPDSFWKEVVNDIDMDKLVSLIVPIYQKHLTEDDIQDINNFYDTPAGAKLISVTPAIMQDSMKAGQKWGKEIGKEIFTKLKEKKYIKEKQY